MRTLLLSLFLCLLLPATPGNAAETAPPPAQNATQKSVTTEQFLAAMLVQAEQGDPRAMLMVANIYQQGMGVQQNYSKVLEWSQKAAFSGDAEGYLRLGHCHEVGMGTAVDMEKAVKAYEVAVSMNNPLAQHKMASMLLTGRGVPKDIAKGLELLQKASDNNNFLASNELGFIFFQGLFGQKQDFARAKALFLKSAEQGNLEGVKNYAIMLKDGLGQKADPAGALRWFLIGQKGGLQGNDLQEILDGLKAKLKPEEIDKAEKAADNFIRAFVERQAQPQPQVPAPSPEQPRTVRQKATK